MERSRDLATPAGAVRPQVAHPERETVLVDDFWLRQVRDLGDDLLPKLRYWRRRAAEWLGPEWRFLPRSVARDNAASNRSIVRHLIAAKRALSDDGAGLPHPDAVPGSAK